MILKQGVKINGLRPEMLLALMVADTVYANNGEELVVTSLLDGQHSRTSSHYSGNAADLRTRYFDEATTELVAAQIRQRLSPDYDVIVEKTHIHIQFKPKR